jgi:hypothetical protein
MLNSVAEPFEVPVEVLVWRKLYNDTNAPTSTPAATDVFTSTPAAPDAPTNTPIPLPPVSSIKASGWEYIIVLVGVGSFVSIGLVLMLVCMTRPLVFTPILPYKIRRKQPENTYFPQYKTADEDQNDTKYYYSPQYKFADEDQNDTNYYYSPQYKFADEDQDSPQYYPVFDGENILYYPIEKNLAWN